MKNSDAIYRHHSQNEPTNIVYANYFRSSVFKVDFNLDDAINWYVKWDRLYVLLNEEDSTYQEYEPTESVIDSMDLKRPDAIEIGCQTQDLQF